MDTYKGSGFLDRVHCRLSRTRLRRVTVLAPTAFFALVAGSVFLVHPHTLPTWVLLLLTLGLAVGGACFFSRFVFTNIQRQEEEIIQRNRELAALNSVSEILSRSVNIDEVLPRALDTTLEVIRMEATEVFLREEETGEMVLRAHRGIFPEAFHSIARFKDGEGIPGCVAVSGEAIVVRDLARDPRFLRTEVVAKGFQAFASVPLKAKEKVLGVLNIAAFDPRRPTQEDMRLLTAIGHQLGMAIENFRLSEQLQVMAVMEERERIARELHDSLAQELALLHLKIIEADHALGSNGAMEVRRALQEMRQIAGEAYEDIRQAIFGLRIMVSKGLGFIPTLTEYLHDFSVLRNVRVDLEVDGAEDIRLSPQVEIQLIRIIHEALTNVFKHAQATRSRVRIERAGECIKVAIEDDGRGFIIDEVMGNGLHFGLFSMRERAEKVGGELLIKTAPGEGTKVIVSFPLSEDTHGSYSSTAGR